ncbi:MAG: GAF domain-containing protein [Planctomycetota bacterium]
MKLLHRVDTLLAGAAPPRWDALLAELLQHFGCVLATVHVIDPQDGHLHLVADRGLPPVVRDKVGVVPIGKGMAGIAADRREPVQVCNLQTDTSGVAKPDARLTRMEGSIAVPMLDGAELRGVFGVAKPVAYDFTAAESALLLQVGARLAAALRR